MDPANSLYSGRYYLWDPRNGITAGPYIEADPGLVKIAPFQLMRAIGDLKAKADLYGKTRRLEIHCHGAPARLLLGTDSGVKRADVAWFGQALRSAVVAGGLVDLLACSVALQVPKSGRLMGTEPKDIEGYVAEYHGKLQKFNMGEPAPSSHGLIFGARPKPQTNKPFAPTPRFAPDPEQDGLEFCRGLARASGATIRAATVKQQEEAKDYRNPLRPSISPIGDWEGPVFDFLPDGSVKFKGISPFRASSFGPIRTDTDFPLKPMPTA